VAAEEAEGSVFGLAWACDPVGFPAVLRPMAFWLRSVGHATPRQRIVYP